jgi:hypothetical protein
MRTRGIYAFILALGISACFVRADTPAYATTGFMIDQSANPGHFSLGYTFGLETQTMISAVGVLDIGGNTIQPTRPMQVSIYYSGPTPDAGTILPGGRLSGFNLLTANVSSSDPILSLSGGTYTSGDGFRYHFLDTPLTLPGGTYMIQESDFGTGFKGAAQNLTLAQFIEGPYHATYNLSDDNSGYGNTLADGELPGFFGPNFLIAPEPGAAALLLVGAAFCLRCKR